MLPSPAGEADPVKVYFDGGCPVCSREIAFYRKWPGAEDIDWVDVSRVDAAALGVDLDRPAAMARMHVRRADGGLVSGAAAFAEMWRHMRGLRWLGRMMALAPIKGIAEVAYSGFLRARSLWR